METLGFMSIDGLSSSGSKHQKATAKKSKLTFSRRYIDNNLFSLHHHSGKDSKAFPTKHGLDVSTAISDARRSLGLTHKYGCTPHDYWVSRRPYPHKESIFTLIEADMLPQAVSKSDRIQSGRKALVLTNTGAIRFDIFKGAFTKDTKFLVSPFTSAFRYIPDVSYNAAKQIIKLLNNEGPILAQMMEHNAFLQPPEILAARFRPHMLPSDIGSYGSSSHEQVVMDGSDPQPFPGYTTHDDAGSDGDDTIHSEIKFYNVPNCIQSTVGFKAEDEKLPETVDLIYNEFIQKWVLLALEYLGETHSSDDTQSWADGKSFTDIMTDWVEENWGSEGECPV
jgi:hypothetical protein